MSGTPKHIYPEIEDAIYLSENSEPHATRYSLTSGPEWDALMERVRAGAQLEQKSAHRLLLQDLLAYLGEAP